MKRNKGQKRNCDGKWRNNNREIKDGKKTVAKWLAGSRKERGDKYE
ncbi:MAG: hypothetical protein J6K48_05995 [Lachnospiraceae bacterium]|nr:hypothetical protein [Lachnospiraceae bacterium]